MGFFPLFLLQVNYIQIVNYFMIAYNMQIGGED